MKAGTVEHEETSVAKQRLGKHVPAALTFKSLADHMVVFWQTISWSLWYYCGSPCRKHAKCIFRGMKSTTFWDVTPCSLVEVQ
jgi:hypothetical protein